MNIWFPIVSDRLGELAMRLDEEGRDIVWPPEPIYKTYNQLAGYVVASLPKADEGNFGVENYR